LTLPFYSRTSDRTAASIRIRSFPFFSFFFLTTRNPPSMSLYWDFSLAGLLGPLSRLDCLFVIYRFRSDFHPNSLAILRARRKLENAVLSLVPPLSWNYNHLFLMILPPSRDLRTAKRPEGIFCCLCFLKPLPPPPPPLTETPSPSFYVGRGTLTSSQVPSGATLFFFCSFLLQFRFLFAPSGD